MLDGKAETSAIAPAARAVPVDDPEFKVDAEMAAKGNVVYATKTCTWCHGLGAVASGGAPDLRASQMALSPPAFAQVVRGGILQTNGMPAYPEITDSELEALRHYLRARARESLAGDKTPTATTVAPK